MCEQGGVRVSHGGRRWRESPLLLLLLALATPLLISALLAESRSHFYRPWGSHDWNSSASLGLAENLSLGRGLLRSHRLPVDSRSVYNRFPAGGVALIKLVIAPFGEDLAKKVLAARMLMLTLFAGAALLAYLALRRILEAPWVAAGATALAFSSFHCLYYSDMIGTEAVMDLFAVMLVWHGMVLFVQEGRFRQLVAKVCLALLVGWHVFALLLGFIALALAGRLWRAWRAGCTRGWRQWPAHLRSLRKHLALGVVAMLFGLAVLSFNLLTEYWALGPASAWDLPTLESMAYRLGIERGARPESPDYLDFGAVFAGQLYRVGAMMLPNPVPDVLPNYPLAEIHHPQGHWVVRAVLLVGAISLPLCVVALWFSKNRVLLGALAFAGMAWALPLHASAAMHDFEAVFHIGVPLTTFSFALLWLRRRTGEAAVRRLGIATLVIFVACNAQMSRLGRDADELRLQTEAREDLQAIRATTQGKRVGVREDVFRFLGAEYALEYYLSGRYLLGSAAASDQTFDGADVIVALGRVSGIDTLTPHNKHVFLYDRRRHLARGKAPAASE